MLTDGQCAELASRLASHWRKLAPKLGLADEKVRCFFLKDRLDFLVGGGHGGRSGGRGGQVRLGVRRLEGPGGGGGNQGGDQLCT